jgi:hypothetical protein
MAMLNNQRVYPTRMVYIMPSSWFHKRFMDFFVVQFHSRKIGYKKQ